MTSKGGKELTTGERSGSAKATEGVPVLRCSLCRFPTPVDELTQ